MSVVPSDLVLYKSATIAADFTTTPIGGAITGTAVTGGSVGEVLFTMGSNIAGSGNKIQYQKLFYKNNNGTTALTSASIYLANGLLVPGSAAVVTMVSDSASDDTGYKVRNLGFDNSGTPVPTQEEVQLNGLTVVTGVTTWSQICRSEARDFGSNALLATIGNVSITVATLLGYIPIGFYSATNEIQIGLQGSLNDTATTTNALTAPGGITFFRAFSVSTALAVANTQSLTAGSAQGIWYKWTLHEVALASPDIQVVTQIIGNTT